jgi:murein DD-endopeptidase MepM/ murein hydrolase activator NlpD
LKRALKKRVKAVLKNTPSSDGAPVEHLNTSNPKVHRRTRAQVAMIGLAISMGATSLLVTRQSDQAHAAAPVGSQKTASTIPAASETEVKLATTKLGSQAVALVSVPENPVVVEPTAVSQAPGLEAKWQVAASGKAVQVPVSEATPTATLADKNSIYLQPQVVLGNSTIKTANNPPVPDGNITSTTSSEVNVQLKAQQELALNRLQEKSNRLKNSLAQLRSEDTTSVLQPAATVGENTVTNPSQASLISRLKQNRETNATTAPSTPTAYEVKPGDTLAAIASNYRTSVAELVKVNNLSHPNQLQINQKLIIPVGKEEQASINQPIATIVAENTPQAVNYQAQVNTAIAPEATPIPIVANGMGGDSPIPTAFTEIRLAPKPTQRIATAKTDVGLESLQAEIERLREKYRAQEAGIAVPVVPETNGAEVPIPVVRTNGFNPQPEAVQIPVPQPIQPSYNAQSVKPLFRVARPANEPINPVFLPNQAIPRNGVNASDSLGKLRGTTVSPQLPPLAAVDQYLPRSIDPATAPQFNTSVAYIWPAKGVLTSGYGMRWGKMHRGIDIANSTGTPIYASAPGVVEVAGWNNGGYGNVVDIRHPDGSMTRYGHNSRILVQVGQQVQQGQQIAAMGSTGFSTGPHSHFEVHPAGKGAVNPIAFLPNRL